MKASVVLVMLGLLVILLMGCQWGAVDRESVSVKDDGLQKEIETVIEVSKVAEKRLEPEGWNQLGPFLILEEDIGDNYYYSSNDKFQAMIDTMERYESGPSLFVDNSQGEESFEYVFVLRGWNSNDLMAYYENGSIAFNIKGVVGNEDIVIELGEKEKFSFHIEDFVVVTQDWQYVEIPLKTIIPDNQKEVLNGLRTVSLKKGKSPAFQIWLNKVAFVSSDIETIYPPIKVNQVGYFNTAEKYAIISGFNGSLNVEKNTPFEVIDIKTLKPIFQGKLELKYLYDFKVSGEQVFIADFTEVVIPGTYHIHIDGLDASPSFQIGEGIYEELLLDLSRYYYFQRANIDLEEKYAGIYQHKDFFPMDFNCPLDSDESVKLDVSKGWYDAGDTGKYVNPGVRAIFDMLWAYQMKPTLFGDENNIPESGNGLSDLLDEVKWELDFIMKMQEEKSGGFYHKIWQSGSPQKSKERKINDIVDGRPNQLPTAVAGSAVGGLAYAYTIYKDIEPDYAEQLLDAAIKGWIYLSDTPKLVPTQDGEPYSDNDDTDDRLFAAAALYLATEDPIYNNYFLENYNLMKKPMEESALRGALCYMISEDPDSQYQAYFREMFMSWREAKMRVYEMSAWHTLIGADQYWWGSLGMILNDANTLYRGSQILGDINDEHLEAVRGASHYVLGINPLRKSMITGHGEDAITSVFSNIYSYLGMTQVPPGYMPGGPNAIEGRKISKFNGKCYIDSMGDWVTNETAIYWNASMLLNTAIISHEEKGYAEK